MLIGPYVPLFDFEVEHAFFPDNRCAGALKFALTCASAALLQRCGFLGRATDSGIAVLADSSHLQALRMIAADIDQPFCLTWLAYAADPLFGNYTAGLVYPPKGLPVFDSAHAVADGTSGRWRLQREAQVSAADALPLDAEIIVQALAGQAKRVAPLFLVTLRLDAAAGGSPAAERRYVLRFAPRTAIWKYWLIGDWREPEMQIVDPDGRAAFSNAHEATLPDGRPAFAIRSAVPLAILRRSPFRFQLRARTAGGERLLVKRLPVAGAAQLTREPDAPGGALVSEIYVHR